jgi:hypothetical protein
VEGYIVHGGSIARGSLARLQDAKGLRVEVWDGELWITQEGDRRDYFVKPGMFFLLGRSGVALAYALQRTQLTLSAAVPAYYARRISISLPDGLERVVYDSAVEPGGWLAGMGHRLTRFWTNAYAPQSIPTTAVL